jgi:hypothetical protein
MIAVAVVMIAGADMMDLEDLHGIRERNLMACRRGIWRLRMLELLRSRRGCIILKYQVMKIVTRGKICGRNMLLGIVAGGLVCICILIHGFSGFPSSGNAAFRLETVVSAGKGLQRMEYVEWRHGSA